MHRYRYLVGLLTLVIAVAGAVWVVRTLRHLDERPGLVLQVEFREARGLRAGTDVRYRGVSVGNVRAVTVSFDGAKAVAQLRLDPAGAAHACVNSAFWIVTPRFAGITDGATGLDTLVRDSYVAFQTPEERGSPLMAGSLIAGKERPPGSTETESLEEVEHGDLLMTLMVPENHGLRPGSAVVYRGVRTGDVRTVALAAAGTHVEVVVRIARRHRQTVTDKAQFWVARPTVSGALFSGFTLSDVSSLLTPFVSYYSEPGKGVPVQDGFRAAALASRPNVEPAPVPAEALRQPRQAATVPTDGLVLVHLTYEAIERDTWSADDPIHRRGSGVLFLDRSGRPVVVTARSLVDGSYTERDTWGGDPEIDDERIQVQLAGGLVLRAGRVWVAGDGADLAALVLEGAPPDLRGTPPARFQFAGGTTGVAASLRAAGPGGAPLPPAELGAPALAEAPGAAVVDGDVVIGVVGSAPTPAVVALERLPADLRPQ